MADEAMSAVAADCSSTAAAMAVPMRATSSMVSVMPEMSDTDCCVACWMAEICSVISSVARAV